MLFLSVAVNVVLLMALVYSDTRRTVIEAQNTTLAGILNAVFKVADAMPKAEGQQH